MADQLAAVPEESMDVSTAAYPPRSIYRDRIRTVAVSGMQIRSPLFFHSQSGHDGFSYSSDSGASNSYSSGTAHFSTDELTTIARRMVSDGYTQSMAQAYYVASLSTGLGGQTQSPSLADDSWHRSTRWIADCIRDGDGRFHVLESWFLELDVAWVLQIRHENGSQGQLCLQDKLASSSQDLVERWIRGLVVMVHSIKLVFLSDQREAVMEFGESSICKMLAFVDAILPAFKPENLWAALDMYACVCWAKDINKFQVALAAGSILVIGLSLSESVEKLAEAISSTMEKVRTLIEEDGSWAIEIPRGGGEVHRNTRWIVDCIVSIREANGGPVFLWTSYYGGLFGLINDTIAYLKDLLLRKSELCSDPSLRYLFLLNNSYFAAQMIEPCQPGHDWKLTPECEKYMLSYLDVSWGHVLSCIPKSHFPGPLHRWINTSSLVKFESAFHKTYQAQKFWKVPDPRLRDELRRAITARVIILGYRDYLGEHPELEKHIGRESSSPEVLQEMLVELFEG